MRRWIVGFDFHLARGRCDKVDPSGLLGRASVSKSVSKTFVEVQVKETFVKAVKFGGSLAERNNRGAELCFG